MCGGLCDFAISKPSTLHAPENRVLVGRVLRFLQPIARMSSMGGDFFRARPVHTRATTLLPVCAVSGTHDAPAAERHPIAVVPLRVKVVVDEVSENIKE
jgi:hypothetical protein